MNAMNITSHLRLHPVILASAIGLACATGSASAQQMDHSDMAMPEAAQEPATPQVPEKTSATKASETGATPANKDATDTSMPAMDHSSMQGMDHSSMQGMDHSAMGADMPMPPAEQPMQGMDHSTMEGMDESRMEADMPMPAEDKPMQGMDHSNMPGMDMPSGADDATDAVDLPATAPPLEPIPPVTPADRAAAFPDVAGHAVHDKSAHYFALLDRLEVQDADDGSAFAWEGLGWVGTDLNRMWTRTEGESVDGNMESAEIEVFYGRAIARWWDAVVGIRNDFGDDPSQTFAAIGVIGMAPYKFEVDATAYVGQGGQTGARVEAEYDTLLTNRLILQWQVEADAYGKDDPRRGIGSGLSTVEAGLRLRYEFRREFAPYIGLVWERAYGGTADFRHLDGEDIDDTRFVAGLRIWF